MSDNKKPSYKIYQGDCQEILPTLKRNSVDAIITDPPYGIGFDYKNKADDKEKNYKKIIDRIFAFEVLLKPGGFMAVYQAAAHARKWSRWFPRKWKLITLPKNFVQVNRGDLINSTDYVLWWRVGEGEKARNWQDFMARDWFICDTSPVNRDKLSRRHPCPRPLDGCKYLVKCFTPEDSLVLDPFMGSGTTGVACIKTKRNFIGIEIDEAYYQVACERLAIASHELPDQNNKSKKSGLNLNVQPTTISTT